MDKAYKYMYIYIHLNKGLVMQYFKITSGIDRTITKN